MRLPRWTVYPALALLAAMLVMAFPHPQQDAHLGAAQRAQGQAEAELQAKTAQQTDENGADSAAPEPASR